MVLKNANPAIKKAIATWFKEKVLSLRDEGLNVRCLFSCQSDEVTSKVLKGLPSFDIGGDGLTRDIATFCAVEGEKIKRILLLSDHKTDFIVDKVSKEAGHMFLYARLVMYNLQQQSRLVDLRKELEPGVFPQGLHEAYGRIISRILDPGSIQRDAAQFLLGTLVSCKRTIKWYEVQGAVSMDLETKSYDFEEHYFRVEAKELCGSLVEVRHGGDVELVHSTAKSYLLEKKHIDLQEEERRMSCLCLEYLRMPCFDFNINKLQTSDMILTGHYAFADYAVAYWSDHVVAALRTAHLDGLKKSSLVKSIRLFLKARLVTQRHFEWIPESLKDDIRTLEEEVFFEELAEAIAIHRIRKRSDQDLLNIVKNTADIENDLSLERTLSHIRSTMYRMHMSDNCRQKLEDMYGHNLFRCYRIDCRSFFEGFETHGELSEHEKKHQRIDCPSAGCPATFSGPSSHNNLQRHWDRVHDRNSDSFAPMDPHQLPSVTTLLKQAVEDQDTIAFEEAPALPHGYTGYEINQPFFAGTANSYVSKELWKSAVRNPNEDMLSLLICRTKFEDTNAQNFILEQAATVGDKELVCQFIDDQFRSLKVYGKDTLLWKRAMMAAAERGDTDILEMLLEKAVEKLDLAEGGLIKKLREICIKAAVAGHTSCVQLLVSKYSVDPFKHVRRKRKRTSDTDATKSDPLRHSVLYHVVEHGQIEIIWYLLALAVDSSLAEPETREVLLMKAAANGFDQIIAILVKGQHLSTGVIEKALASALFCKAVRYGRQEQAENLLETHLMLDKPDRNNCSPLIYAAYNGLEGVVKHLIQKGADMERRGSPQEVGVAGRYGDASEWAKSRGHLRVCKLLEDASEGGSMRLVKKKIRGRKVYVYEKT